MFTIRMVSHEDGGDVSKVVEARDYTIRPPKDGCTMVWYTCADIRCGDDYICLFPENFTHVRGEHSFKREDDWNVAYVMNNRGKTIDTIRPPRLAI